MNLVFQLLLTECQCRIKNEFVWCKAASLWLNGLDDHSNYFGSVVLVALAVIFLVLDCSCCHFYSITRQIYTFFRVWFRFRVAWRAEFWELRQHLWLEVRTRRSYWLKNQVFRRCTWNYQMLCDSSQGNSGPLDTNWKEGRLGLSLALGQTVKCPKGLDLPTFEFAWCELDWARLSYWIIWI